MIKSDKARILIVDDRPEEGRTLERELGAAARTFSPDDVTEQDLRSADLVLVDYDLSDWEPSAGRENVATSPADGLALSAVLRSHAMPDYSQGRPVSFALHSSQLEKIGGSLSREMREHAIARVHNLEWVFDKTTTRSSPGSLPSRVLALAEATRLLPDDWPSEPGKASATLREILGWNEQLAGAELAWQQVSRCRPPLHELSAATDGLTCLRWLAHRILPYPCFLYDSIYAAARLGIDLESFSKLIADSHVAGELEELRYRGALAELVGPRWWRAGLEAWLWTQRSAAASEGCGLHAALEVAAGHTLVSNQVVDPVVVFGDRYLTVETPISAADAVRVSPDDWPSFADDAWVSIEFALDNPWVQDQVLSDDLPILKDRANL